MSFKQFPKQMQGVQLLQRSLARGRLGHAYLFAGPQLEELESLARTLAKTLNCLKPVRPAARQRIAATTARCAGKLTTTPTPMFFGLNQNQNRELSKSIKSLNVPSRKAVVGQNLSQKL